MKKLAWLCVATFLFWPTLGCDDEVVVGGPPDVGAAKPKPKPKPETPVAKKPAKPEPPPEPKTPEGKLAAGWQQTLSDWSNGKLHRVTDRLDDNAFVELVGAPDAETRGKAGIRDLMRANRRAFPDYRVVPSRIFVSGETVVAEVVVTGTHKGPLKVGLRDVEGTQKKFGVHGLQIATFKAGKIVSLRLFQNNAHMLVQLGLTKLGPGIYPELVSPSKEDPKIFTDKGDPANFAQVETLVRQWQNQKDFSAMFAPAFEAVDHGTGASHNTYETIAAERDGGMKLFSNVKLTAEQTMLIGPYVIAEISFIATFKDTTNPKKPVNRDISSVSANLFKFEDGKIERWTAFADPTASTLQMSGTRP